MTDKAAHLQKMQAKLNEWEAYINALQANVSGASVDTNIELNKQIDSLRVERSDIKQLADTNRKLRKNRSTVLSHQTLTRKPK